MTETPCPTYPWCKITCQHAAVHVALVALLHDAAVSIRAFGGPAEVTVTAYEPGTFIPAGIPPTVLTPTAARTRGQALVARGRDTELGEALIAAADLAEGAGRALTGPQLGGGACPTWCTTEGKHTLHYRLVGRQGDITVTLRQSGDSLPEIATPDGQLTLAAAHFLGQALIEGGQDAALGELLVRAADLAEGGGHAAGALSDAQLDGTACIRCGAAEGWPMIPAGHGPRGRLFECSYHAEIGEE